MIGKSSWADDAESSDEDVAGDSEVQDIKDEFTQSSSHVHKSVDSEVTNLRKFPDSPPFVAFVGSLNFRVQAQELGQFFENGDCKVRDVNIHLGLDGKPRGFAHVEFEDLESLKRAMDADGFEFHGRKIRVDLSEGKRENKERKHPKDRDSYRSHSDRQPYRNEGYSKPVDRSGLHDDRGRERERGEKISRGQEVRNLNPDTKADLLSLPVPVERTKVVIAPRTRPLEEIGKPAQPKESIFGGGRPRDETALEEAKRKSGQNPANPGTTSEGAAPIVAASPQVRVDSANDPEETTNNISQPVPSTVQSESQSADTLPSASSTAAGAGGVVKPREGSNVWADRKKSATPQHTQGQSAAITTDASDDGRSGGGKSGERAEREHSWRGEGRGGRGLEGRGGRGGSGRGGREGEALGGRSAGRGVEGRGGDRGSDWYGEGQGRGARRYEGDEGRGARGYEGRGGRGEGRGGKEYQNRGGRVGGGYPGAGRGREGGRRGEGRGGRGRNQLPRNAEADTTESERRELPPDGSSSSNTESSTAAPLSAAADTPSLAEHVEEANIKETSADKSPPSLSTASQEVAENGKAAINIPSENTGLGAKAPVDSHSAEDAVPTESQPQPERGAARSQAPFTNKTVSTANQGKAHAIDKDRKYGGKAASSSDPRGGQGRGQGGSRSSSTNQTRTTEPAPVAHKEKHNDDLSAEERFRKEMEKQEKLRQSEETKKKARATTLTRNAFDVLSDDDDEDES